MSLDGRAAGEFRGGGPRGGGSRPDRSGPAADPGAPYARLAAVGLIHRDDDRGGDGAWLLLRRSEPVDAWDPPGGRMEEGEDLVAAVMREVAEETGLAVRVGGPCYALLTFYEGERLLAVSMACRPVGDPDRVRLELGGAGDWRWASAEEWRELAAEGRSTWRVDDVSKATRMATALWEAEAE
jgi:8-oxo-dGTP pyrophosphatase MutT (NUDIX family)